VPRDLPPGVGETAVGAAMMRARESERMDALFVDPWAGAFVAAVPPIFEDGPTADDDPAIAVLEAAFEEVVAVRTRFFDQCALDAAAAGCRQVVVVGAGLDARAFRLDWPIDVHLFELDLPEVLAFKDDVLTTAEALPRCQRVPVPLDLQDPDWPARLIDGGFSPEQPVAWIVEGLVPYLTADAAERLLVEITRHSAPGSRLALDHARGSDDPLLTQARGIAVMDEVTAMWKGGFSDDAAGWLTREGWDVVSTDGAALSEQLGRGTGNDLHGVFLAATRRVFRQP
jgi:methyltransferase (TIGR00027 family)